MNWKPLLLGLILWMGGGRAALAQEYNLHWYGNAEGLGNLSIRAFQQDGTGFLWALSEHELYRYDGERFEKFGARQGLTAEPDAIGLAPDGSLLVGGRSGLYQFTRNRFAKFSDVIVPAGANQRIQADATGAIYLATAEGLVKLRPRAGGAPAVTRYPQAPGTNGAEATALLVDGGTVWYGCGRELCRLEESGKTTVWGRAAGLPETPILSIRKDGAGSLWVNSTTDGLFVLAAGESGFVRPKTPLAPRLLDKILSVDAEGRILIPSGKGLLIGSAGGWRILGQANGLRSADQTFCALEDRSHALWVGMSGRGAVEWRGYQQWESYSTESGLASDLIFEILPRPGGVVWVGTNSGLVRGVEEGPAIRWKRVEAAGEVTVHCVAEGPDGWLWLGSERRGLGRYSPQTGRMEWLAEEKTAGATVVLALRFDRKGRLWLGTELGLVTATAPYTQFHKVEGAGRKAIWAIVEGSDGTLWAGGGSGLFALDGDTWRRFQQADGLSSEAVESLGAAPDGSVWVGYQLGGGIDRVRLRGGRLQVEKGIQRPGTDGLVYFLGHDALGQVWAGTEHGVDLWNGKHWAHFDSTNGLVWNDCDLNAFAAEPDGTVWIGTSGGLSRRRPRNVGLSAAPARVVFTKILLGDREVAPEEGEIPAGHAEKMDLRFSALNAERHSGTLFRYRLGGPGAAWNETEQRELHFPRLAPGRYRLEVEAQNSDGSWGSHPAVLRFRVLPPWYLTWWFAGLCGLAVVLIGVVVVRIRLSVQRTRERELNQLVEQRTEELKKATREAVQANEAKSSFLATMSHEIRTPMNGILPMAQLLMAPELDGETRRQYADVILSCGQTLLTLLNDILDLSKIEARRIELRPSPFGPEQLLREVSTLFAERATEKHLLLDTCWHGAAGACYSADAIRLRQMLSNYVNNALKFTRQGHISIEGREVSADGQRAVVEFWVTDTGIGIPESQRALLFKPFSQLQESGTRQEGGTGLGLSIVSNLARLMGGEAGLESEEGRGSRFYFRIHAERAERPGSGGRQAERLGDGGQPALAGKRVLIVEDNPVNRFVVEAMLKKIGAAHESCANGAEAVARIAAGARPDLVLMDCQMPVMDGYEATRRIRQAEQEQGADGLPIVALTANAFEEDRQRCMAAGMNDVLTKPLALQALEEALLQCLRGD